MWKEEKEMRERNKTDSTEDRDMETDRATAHALLPGQDQHQNQQQAQ